MSAFVVDLQTRRTTRVTRATAPSDENAVAAQRSSKATLASKDASKPVTKPAASSRTASSQQGKDASTTTAAPGGTAANGKQVLGTRKRAAFGEVTNKREPAGSVAAAGGASKAGASKAGEKQTTVVKAPRRTRASTAAEEAIDDQPAKNDNNDDTRPIAVRKRAATATTATGAAASTSTTARGRRPAVAGASTSRSRVPSTSTTSKREALDDVNGNEIDDDALAVPTKRARTSSPFKAEGVTAATKMEVEAEQKQSLKETLAQEVADTKPAKDEGWQDLDAEDDDDPMMVNEYVRDIFIYMQKLEVRPNLPLLAPPIRRLGLFRDGGLHSLFFFIPRTCIALERCRTEEARRRDS